MSNEKTHILQYMLRYMLQKKTNVFGITVTVSQSFKGPLPSARLRNGKNKMDLT